MCHNEQLENQTEKDQLEGHTEKDQLEDHTEMEHTQIAEDHKAPYNEGHKSSWHLKKEKPQEQNSQLGMTNRETQ